MKFKLNIKPLSINKAFQGRRFKTSDANNYDKQLALLLPKEKVVGEYFRVSYNFHLINFSITDADNLVKMLQDAVVRREIIPDDRRIVEYKIKKFPSDTDYIEVEIEAIEAPLKIIV